MGKRTLPLSCLPRKLIIELVSQILKELGFERTMDYLPLTGHRDVYEFKRGEEKIMLTIDKRGEMREEFTLQGPDKVVDEVILELALRSTEPIYQTLLGAVIDEGSLNQLLKRIERDVRSSYRPAAEA
jgi:hypothetical protein